MSYYILCKTNAETLEEIEYILNSITENLPDFPLNPTAITVIASAYVEESELAPLSNEDFDFLKTKGLK